MRKKKSLLGRLERALDLVEVAAELGTAGRDALKSAVESLEELNARAAQQSQQGEELALLRRELDAARAREWALMELERRRAEEERRKADEAEIVIDVEVER